MSSLTLTHTNGSKSHSSEWASQTVQQFFSAINWDDTPPVVIADAPLPAVAVPGQPTELSMMMTVSQFFGAVNWDGVAIAAAPSPSLDAMQATPAPVNEFTLDDFSSLF